MVDGSISASIANRKTHGMSLLAGFLIAGSCFILLFAGLAHLIPMFDRFAASAQFRLFPAFSIVLISVSGLIRYLRQRAKRAQVRDRS
jgi:hypothetical protein